jgi:hypothetical protein
MNFAGGVFGNYVRIWAGVSKQELQRRLEAEKKAGRRAPQDLIEFALTRETVQGFPVSTNRKSFMLK